MVHFLKSFFGKRDAESVVLKDDTRVPQPVEPASPAPLAAPSAAPAAASAPPRKAPVPPAVAPAPLAPRKDLIQLSLKPILSRLTPALLDQVKAEPAETMKVSAPLATVLAQLPRGTVRITFAELKQGLPAGIFSEARDQDQTMVELPLAEILAVLKPGQIQRRERQNRLTVPEEILPVFPAVGAGGRNETPRLPEQPAAAEIPAARVPQPMAEEGLKTPPATATAASAEEGKHPASEAKERPGETSSAEVAAPEEKPLRMQAAAAPAQEASEVGGEELPDYLAVPLSLVIQHWPKELVGVTAKYDLGSRVLNVPMAELEPRLRKGRIVFKWNQVERWISPTLSMPAGSAMEFELELPLPSIAPLFLARTRMSRKKRPKVGEDIPDVFGAGKPPASGGGETSIAAESGGAGEKKSSGNSAGSRKPSAAPPAVLNEARAAGADARSSGSSGARAGAGSTGAGMKPDLEGAKDGRAGGDWSPDQVVEHVCCLPGVTGALIATLDGFSVAGKLPPNRSLETVSAFLPQLFRALNECAEELRLGQPQEFLVHLGLVPMQITKLDQSFLAVLGRTGEPLPKAQAAELAARLAPPSTS